MIKVDSNILKTLCCCATNSKIEKQLAAVIIKNGKMVSKPCCNIQRSTCRRNTFGSLHAEANALLNYYGKKNILKK